MVLAEATVIPSQIVLRSLYAIYFFNAFLRRRGTGELLGDATQQVAAGNLQWRWQATPAHRDTWDITLGMNMNHKAQVSPHQHLRASPEVPSSKALWRGRTVCMTTGKKAPKDSTGGKHEEYRTVPYKNTGTSWSMFLSLGSEMNGWRGWKNG